MRNIVVLLLFSICSLLSFQSCGDDGPLEDKECYIEYRITCDTPNAQMHIAANDLGAKGVYAKGSYKNDLKTKDYFAVIKVKCDDRKALISVELYVNKKLRAKKSGNSTVYISERLKGKGPYLE